MKIKFSIIGLIIFILPMIINIVYFAIAPKGNDTEGNSNYKWIEMIEQISRILYMITICFIERDTIVNFKSPWMFISAVFLVLYYMVWIRYFAGGMDVSLMSKSFLLVPIPLAVFPVLYFLFSAVWLQNYIAVACMVVFGISHFTVSYFNLCK